MSDLVIIGGGGAGLTAALKAKKTDFKMNVTLVTNQELSYSPCSLPFVISGEIPDIESISHSLKDICNSSGIDCIIDEVVSIDAVGRKVKTTSDEISFDRLIIATGGKAFMPPIKGIDLNGVYTVYTVDDAKKIMTAAENSSHAVVIGGGAIGIETAVALREKGLNVSLVEGFPHVLSRFLDPYFSECVEKGLTETGIELVLGHNVEELTGTEKVRSVKVAGRDIAAEIVIMATGVRPGIQLAKDAGAAVGFGIETDDRMESSLLNVYAAGDCAMSTCIVTGKKVPSLLGTTAVRQGTVAGINSAGGDAVFRGVTGSMILKICEGMQVGRCGLTESEAKEAGIKTVTGKIKSTTAAEYYPGAKEIEVKLIFAASSETLVGGQVIGGSDVADKINLLSFAISKRSTADELAGMEYCYTPPLAPSHNPIVQAAENAQRKIKKIRERENRSGTK